MDSSCCQRRGKVDRGLGVASEQIKINEGQGGAGQSRLAVQNEAHVVRSETRPLRHLVTSVAGAGCKRHEHSHQRANGRVFGPHGPHS